MKPNMLVLKWLRISRDPALKRVVEDYLKCPCPDKKRTIPFSRISRNGLDSLASDHSLIVAAEDFHLSRNPTFRIGKTITLKEFERRLGI